MTHLSSHSVQDLLLTNYVDRYMYQILRQIRHNQIITKTTHAMFISIYYILCNC